MSETWAHICVLESQVQPEREDQLRRLGEQKAAILANIKDHLQVLAPIRNIPEDVLREICIACVSDEIPTLCHHTTSLPSVLAQISRGMRHIALATPIIWTRMDIQIRDYRSGKLRKETYLGLARRVQEWFDRAGGLPLTLIVRDPNRHEYSGYSVGDLHQVKILLDTLFSYSARWKEVRFDSRCVDESSPLIFQFYGLKKADTPLLQSVWLDLSCSLKSYMASSIDFLQTSALRHVSLITPNVRHFRVNWTVLTSVSLDGKSNNLSRNEIAHILRQTKHLVLCDIVISPPSTEDIINLQEVNLPFLEKLRIAEKYSDLASPDASSLLDLIYAPTLTELDIDENVSRVLVIGFYEEITKYLEDSCPLL